MRTHLLLGTLLSALGLAGCGQLEGDTDRLPVIATIHGQLSNPDGYAAGANMRVAIVWGAVTGDVRVSQDVQVQPVFPSQFRLDLRELPPSDAMRVPEEDVHNGPDGPSTCTPGYDPSSGKPPPAPGATSPCDSTPPDGDRPPPSPAPPPPSTRIQSDDWRGAKPSDPFKIAVGTVIAYEDLNGNGQLDLLDANATQAIDRVVGVNRDLFVIYVEGKPVGDVAKLALPAGFSLVGLSDCSESADAEPSEATGGASVTPEDKPSCDSSPKVHAIGTMFTLPLTASPQLSSFMCKGEGSFSTLTSTAPKSSAVAPAPAASPSSFPKPSDPSLHCRVDGNSYSYTECPTSKSLCSGGDTLCATTLVTRSTTTAVGEWPCPAQ